MTHARQLVARQLIDDATFGADASSTIRQAFDEVWGEIAFRFGTHLVAIEAARLELADTLLSIASEESRDVEVLKCFALQAMTRHDRQTLPTRATSAQICGVRDWWAELCVEPS
jgi:dGTP triphosphohydrolase